MREHTTRRPGSRPWCWWQFSAPGERRVIEIDQTTLAYDEGRVYETERDYLERLDLLTPAEKEIFEKYGDIVFVRVSSGMYGECKDCWEDARESAKDIDFDLDVAIRFKRFWLPQS